VLGNLACTCRVTDKLTSNLQYCTGARTRVVYITIGNLPSIRHNRPGSMAVLLLPLLPVPSKFAKSSATDKLQRQINANTLQGIFKLIFEPLRDTTLEGVPMDCADSKIQRCFPILSGWIADHMENATLHRIKTNACPKCEVTSHELETGVGGRAGEVEYGV